MAASLAAAAISASEMDALRVQAEETKTRATKLNSPIFEKVLIFFVNIIENYTRCVPAPPQKCT
jgi:hypothetical protein